MKAKFKPSDKEILNWITDLEKNFIKNIDFKKFAPLISAETARVFVTEGFGQWPQLSKSYAARKAKIRPNATILRLTDNYFNAATQVGNARNLMKVFKDGITYGVQGFEPNYPLFHELGTVKMQPRPVWEKVSESEALRNNVILLFRKQINENIQKEGKKFFNLK